MQEIVQFKSDTGIDVVITPQDVKNTLCPAANDKEIAMFLELCRAQRLNPFIKDAYLVKYGSAPASIITGKEVFTKRANANKNYEGFEAGVTFIANGKVQHREGSAVYKEAGEVLVGGWCRVFVKGRKPFYDEVTLAEYSTGKSNWAKMPATMIRKVALVHCLREAFPDDFQGLYAAEEMGRVGEVEQGQNVPANAATAPETIEAEAVVIEDAPITQDQQQRLDALVHEFGEMRGQTPAAVYGAIGDSTTLQAAGYKSGAMTAQQAEAAMQLVEYWISKAKEQQIETEFEAEQAEAMEVGEDGLYTQDVEF